VFWKKKPSAAAAATPADLLRRFEMAKEATRRATFLNGAARMPGGEPVAEGLATVFRVCRTVAISAGAAVGQSQAQVDAAIEALCVEDVARIKAASDDEIREFSAESGKVVNAFIASLDPQTLAEAAKA